MTQPIRPLSRQATVHINLGIIAAVCALGMFIAFSMGDGTAFFRNFLVLLMVWMIYFLERIASYLRQIVERTTGSRG